MREVCLEFSRVLYILTCFRLPSVVHQFTIGRVNRKHLYQGQWLDQIAQLSFLLYACTYWLFSGFWTHLAYQMS